MLILIIINIYEIFDFLSKYPLNDTQAKKDSTLFFNFFFKLKISTDN